VSRVARAVSRAEEAETLAADLPPGCERAMLEQIARLWREFAQHQMAAERRPRQQ
jgi:hypothetical protein